MSTAVGSFAAVGASAACAFRLQAHLGEQVGRNAADGLRGHVGSLTLTRPRGASSPPLPASYEALEQRYRVDLQSQGYLDKL
jgi:hypothetical protein